MNLTFVTGNKHKLEEASAILDQPLESIDVDIEEIQSMDLENIVIDKANKAYEVVKKSLFVEDSGLFIESLNGFPGPFIKWVFETNSFEFIPEMIESRENKKAIFSACIAYHDGKNVRTFRGDCHGIIVKPRGTGFGVDPIFIPDGFDKTFGELTKEQKNSVSHRKKALEKFKRFLTN